MTLVDTDQYRLLVQCRAFGHAWDNVDLPRRVARSLAGFTQSARCVRCVSVRVQELGWDGRVISTQYTYEPAYHNVTSMSRHDAKVMLHKLNGGRVPKTREGKTA